ncbi:MAG: translation initiation factor IF-2 N-terminal domain-containing protein [Dialister invisus]
MQKYRIYELAKIYNKGNDEIIAVLNKNNIEVKNRLNSVDEKAKRDSRQSFCISFCQKE